MSFFDDRTLKKILYTFVGVLIFSIVTLVGIYLWYEKKIEDQIDSYGFTTEEYEVKDSFKEVSSTQDKNIVDASKNKMNNVSENSAISNVKTENKVSNTNVENNKVSKNNTQNDVNVETKKEEVVKKKELKFEAPVSGEIQKDFANDTLLYSETLKEWTTHLGIDIKGEKTSVVKASEDGVIESIKNDPRYGVTIIIKHDDGFKTVYSNLLSTDFVKEGDKVQKGDTIATIGETASFEVLDEPHLHFELYKDNIPVNPTSYFK